MMITACFYKINGDKFVKKQTMKITKITIRKFWNLQK